MKYIKRFESLKLKKGDVVTVLDTSEELPGKTGIITRCYISNNIPSFDVLFNDTPIDWEFGYWFKQEEVRAATTLEKEIFEIERSTKKYNL